MFFSSLFLVFFFFFFWGGGVTPSSTHSWVYSQIATGRLREPNQMPGFEPPSVLDWLHARHMLYHCAICPTPLFIVFSLVKIIQRQERGRRLGLKRQARVEEMVQGWRDRPKATPFASQHYIFHLSRAPLGVTPEHHQLPSPQLINTPTPRIIQETAHHTLQSLGASLWVPGSRISPMLSSLRPRLQAHQEAGNPNYV